MTLCASHAPSVAGAVISLNIATDIIENFMGISGNEAKQMSQVCIRFAMGVDATTRLLAGGLMHLTSHEKLPRSLFLIAAPSFLVFAHVIIAFADADETILYVAMASLGICDALCWATTPWLGKHLFGVSNAASILGSITLSVSFMCIAIGFVAQPALLRTGSLLRTHEMYIGIGIFSFIVSCYGLISGILKK